MLTEHQTDWDNLKYLLESKINLSVDFKKINQLEKDITLFSTDIQEFTSAKTLQSIVNPKGKGFDYPKEINPLIAQELCLRYAWQ